MSRTDVVRRALPALGVLGIALSIAVAFVTLETAPEPPVAAVSAAKVVTLTNDERADAGLSRLARNEKLDHAAQMKAEDMARKGYYAHVSPDGVTPVDWVEKAGYKYLIVGENLVVERTDAAQVVDAFMGSPGHRANILRKDFTEIGVGIADGTYKGKDATFTVQLFAAPYPGSRAVSTEKDKENVKQSSSGSASPTPAKKPAVATVPRAPVAQKPAAVPVIAPQKAPEQPVSEATIQEKVKVLIKPLLEPLQATGTPATSTASSSVPSPVEAIRPFFLNEAPPVDIANVSRLEPETPPVPVGLTWTMQFRAFLEDVVLSAWSLFRN